MSALAALTTLLRGLHLAAMLSLLGAAAFAAWIVPSGGYEASRQRALKAAWISGAVALLAGAAWFAVESAAIAGAESPSDLLGALPVVALRTRFGNVALTRLALLAIATALSARGRRAVWPGLGCALAAVAPEGLIGHAGATAGAVGYGLVASEALHLAAAGLWLGALLPLWLTLRFLPPSDAAFLCERFSPLGLACILVIAGTGVAQALALAGGFAALVGTEYGNFLLLKIALFTVAMVLAAINRLTLTDRLSADAGTARRHLMLSVAVETAVGLAIIGAAAFLASAAPVQPF